MIQQSTVDGQGDGVRRGFTLIEMVVVLAIAGIVLFSLTLGINQHVFALKDKLNIQWASLIAEDLMLEIRSKSFADPQTPARFGPEESLPRGNFDDVDDYDGLSNSPPQTIGGVTMTNCSDFAVIVAVDNVSDSDLNTATPAADGSTSFKRITIVVQKGALYQPAVVVTNRSIVSQYE